MSKNNIIEVGPTDPDIGVFYVRKSWDDKASQILVTHDINKAKDVVNSDADKYYVFNHKGVMVYREPIRPRTSMRIKPNTVFKPVSINLYSHPESTIPAMAYTGALTIVTGTLRNDKLQVLREDLDRNYFVKMDDVSKYFQ